MSLGVLVGRFGIYVREAHESAPPPDDRPPPKPFPDKLNHVREAVSHHLIPLMLLARSDNDFSPLEADVIVAHCIWLADRRGLTMDDQHTQLLAQYVSGFHPTLVQLGPALNQLSGAPYAEVVRLVGAAKDVIDADGVTRPEETKFFEELSEGLAALKPAH